MNEIIQSIPGWMWGVVLMMIAGTACGVWYKIMTGDYEPDAPPKIDHQQGWIVLKERPIQAPPGGEKKKKRIKKKKKDTKGPDVGTSRMV